MRESREEWSQAKWSSQTRRWWWQSIRPVWNKMQWPIIWTLALVALALGYRGFGSYYAEQHIAKTSRDLIYNSLRLFTLESGDVVGHVPWQLEAARWLAPAVTIYTATKAFLVIFHDQLVSLRLWFYHRHVVICGLGRKGFLLCRAFRRQGYRVVVIDLNEQNEMIERCREEGAIVLIGNAAQNAMLRKARVHRARYLFSVFPDDGANAEVAGLARELVKNRKGVALTCLIHILEPQLRDLLSEREFATTGVGGFHLDFFNVFQTGARTLIKTHPPFAEDRDNRPIHLLVIGLGRMGQSLIALAAGEWYATAYPTRGRLRITVIDKEVETRIKSLLFRHPQVETICELIPQQMDIYSLDFQHADFLLDEDRRSRITSAYVCLDNDASGLYAGLALLKLFKEQSVSVVVRMTFDAGLATLLRGEEWTSGRYANLRSFNLLDQTCNEHLLPGTLIETIASAIHNNYVSQQEALDQTPQTNPSMAPWEELPESLQESNRRQARHIKAKLQVIGCRIEPLTDGHDSVREFSPTEVELMAMMEHDRWNDERRQDGWTYHPGKKNFERKTHPHLVSWEKLPDEVKEYDRQAVRAIPSVLAAAGYMIVRVQDASQ